MEIKQYTEDSITLLFGEEIHPDTNKKIVNIRKYIDSLQIDGVVETIISYTRLVIYFDVLIIENKELIKIIQNIDMEQIIDDEYAYRIVEVPVCYGGDYGPDMWRFEEKNISMTEVIERHANKEYLVYMLGFMPGFVYLGGLDEKIAMNRLDSPRTNIDAGSVGIAGHQTGVYPYDSPGGWNLIGRTPIKLYDIRRGEDTILYDAGDRIVFKPITEEEYDEIKINVDAGTYIVPVTLEGGGV